jgi:TolB-like protein
MRIDAASKNELPPDVVRSALERLLGSRVFAQSTRLSRFLKFGVEAALTGRMTVNEYSIGVDVFEKKGGFDPRIDPIVRVHARRLRSKLKQYYDTEGSDDPIEISLPLRTYVPVFRARPAKDAVEKRLAAFRSTPEVADSILVFPFTNLSTSKDDDYFAEGLTRELIHELSMVKEWRVIAWHSGGAEARQPDFRDLGKQLHAGAALWGTIRTNQKALRISAELSSVPDRTVLWSQMYVFESEDPLRAQEQLAHTICQGLRARAEAHAATPVAGTQSPEARKRCVRGVAQRASNGRLNTFRKPLPPTRCTQPPMRGWRKHLSSWPRMPITRLTRLCPRQLGRQPGHWNAILALQRAISDSAWWPQSMNVT